MAFHYYFNMEPLTLKISKKHIEYMSNENFIDGDDVFLDDTKLMNNLENGFVALTQLSCYFESFLNTILNSCMKYEREILLKCSIEEKLEIIFMHYEKNIQDIKSLHYWQSYKIATKIRNEMIHFKRTSIGWGSGIPDFKIGNHEVSTYFIRDNMIKVYNDYISLSKRIAKKIDLEIFQDMSVFSCDGRCSLVNYVYDPNSIEKEDIEYLELLHREGLI